MTQYIEGIKDDLYWYLLKRIVMDKLYYKKQFVFLEFDLLLKFNSFSMICFPIVSIYNTEKEVVINRMRRKYGFGDDKFNFFAKDKYGNLLA